MRMIIAISTIFLLVPASCSAEPISRPDNLRSKTVRLEIREGRISTDFSDVSVSVVLEEIRRQSEMQYRVPAEVARFGVSASVKDLPLDQSLAYILAPFNYVITQADSPPYHTVVQLLGLKQNMQQSPGSNPRPDSLQAPGFSDLLPATEAQTTSVEFPGAAKTREATQPPAAQPSPAKTTAQRPVHNPVSFPVAPTGISNTTGPIAPITGQVRELPSFTPITNQTGPVPQR